MQNENKYFPESKSDFTNHNVEDNFNGIKCHYQSDKREIPGRKANLEADSNCVLRKGITSLQGFIDIDGQNAAF